MLLKLVKIEMNFPLRINGGNKLCLILLYRVVLCVFWGSLKKHSLLKAPTNFICSLWDELISLQLISELSKIPFFLACVGLWVAYTCMCVSCIYMEPHMACMCLHVDACKNS